MNKQEQIEDIQKILPNIEVVKAMYGDFDLAELLYDRGVRKIPKNAVVLTGIEYEIVLDTQKHLEKKYSDMQDELNFYKNENEIVKQNYIQLEQDNRQAHRETASEFAKKVKSKIKELKKIYHEDCINGTGDEEYNGVTESDIDELLKEIE